MSLQLGSPQNVILIIATVLGWGVVFYWILRQYRGMKEKPVIWKMLFATLVGIFSASGNFTIMSTTVKLSILPLGVWVLYFFLRNGSWSIYRKFAWIGFFSSYIFVATTLLGSLLHHVVYDKSDPFTYVADTGKAQLVSIHPSASDVTWDQHAFQDGMRVLEFQQSRDTLNWYYESAVENGVNYGNERFPYAVVGAKSRWGSGYEASLYLEYDGKGLLIQTPERHYYFRSEEPLLDVEVTIRED
ncbi:hypothetical protein [Paenibacillus paeoniae]|uniref:Uncharacterized protein n=1 Tax=Paenibacillus paeoniae TaxID=2292705 RepID=A0A371P5Z2_9BACL|nr:hypothetical protein [Paenibacillus paeoniae]REK71275.1 hypothetical protein DX130_22810 [Paenibacillus paeoniae]